MLFTVPHGCVNNINPHKSLDVSLSLLRASSEERYDIRRIGAGYGIIRDELHISAFIK